MTTIILIFVGILIIGYLLKNKLIRKFITLFNTKANKAINKAIDPLDVLTLKEEELSKKKKDIILSIARMKANQLKNEANLKELQIKIDSLTTLAKKYKEEDKKEKCLQILPQIHIKESEFNNLNLTNEELKKYIESAEKQLQLFKNNTAAILSKISVIENKKINSEALSTLSGLTDNDEDINKLIEKAGIEYDTTTIASESILSENSVDLELQNIDINKAYDNL